ncbi:cytochrome c3 family protein [Adlercreutzia faecimuris]|uniref:Cytochrome c3 family protein n=1 Tax=Adlercreutzia faecimuris TaxID=2897341 RepID=A0ABS9WI92_9ACTN|nr:cytochrome c3 family protein [Adlercreutzia sp. JBNU-10]MCI2242603.1 cytochrome c3 family protein [Adlercreutzia sp. JBNU-10]
MTEEKKPAETRPETRRARKRWPVAAAVVAAVVIVAGAGFYAWHEQPSFCNAVCHAPMDPYLPTYEAEPGQAALDKWGNEVSEAASMMAASHRAADGTTCMGCHVPTLGEQVSEGMAWVAGDYYDPLDERSLAELGAARELEGDEFCLNEACHANADGTAMTRDDLAELTADREFNPHVTQHEERACSDCHKAHRASVMVCSQCHAEAEVPEGWITPVQDAQLLKPIPVA